MQAVIFDTLGISALQSRKASLVHICWASGLNARLADGKTNKESAKVETMAAMQVGLAIMVEFPKQ